MDGSISAEQSTQSTKSDQLKAYPGEVEKIQQLLKAKDDTSRFVGLALLKSTLDNSPELQNDKEVITSLWDSISSKFLDRLLRTGLRPVSEQKDAKDMLDLVVTVLYTFTVLLPDESKSDIKLLGRIPKLVQAVLHSSGETTDLLIKTLLTLVSTPEGGITLIQVEDWSPLIELAPKQPHILSIFTWSWLQGDIPPDYRNTMREKIDNIIYTLTASFKGTDGVTLLEFLDNILGRLDDDLIPQNPRWLGAISGFIRGLSTSRPTAASREAYTNCAARILMLYPQSAPQMLFFDNSNSSKPFSYIFISLIIIDIRASLPTLLEKLNSPNYPATSNRLTSSHLILSSFIVFLVRQMDMEAKSTGTDVPFSTTFNMTPDLILKLNSSISETISLIIEYLRDRWDAAVAGAQGLHPEARIGESHTASGSHRTLAWDSKHEPVNEDPLLLAALRVLGVWLREDDGETLRKEAASLMDLLMDLYETHSRSGAGIGYRGLVLGVLDGITQTDDGIQCLLEHKGWAVLSKDLLAIVARASPTDTLECDLGQQAAVVLSTLAETECRRATPEDWLDYVTGLAAYNMPVGEGSEVPAALQILWADVLQLAATLLVHARSGVKKRYVHSARAVMGLATMAITKAELGSEALEQLRDVVSILQKEF